MSASSLGILPHLRIAQVSGGWIEDAQLTAHDVDQLTGVLQDDLPRPRDRHPTPQVPPEHLTALGWLRDLGGNTLRFASSIPRIQRANRVPTRASHMLNPTSSRHLVEPDLLSS